MEGWQKFKGRKAAFCYRLAKDAFNDIFHHTILHCITLCSLKTATENILWFSVFHFSKLLTALFRNTVFSRPTIPYSVKSPSTTPKKAFPKLV